jgi:plasmid stability protein
MVVQTLTLNLPDVLYARLRQRAELAHRSVEAELLEVLAMAVPITDEVPAELSEALSQLSLLDDEVLWRAARGHLSEEIAEQLETLHVKRQREGLTDAEAQTLTALVQQYERAMLVRAQAAALLHERGYHVGELTAKI